MKSILLAVIVIISIMPIYSQQVKPSIQLTQEEYLQRSKKQKKLGWTMLAGGAVLFTVGSITALNTVHKTFPDAIMPGIGLGMMLGSIPVFTISASSKNKSNRVYFETQPVSYLQENGLMDGKGIAVKLRFTLE